MWISEKEKQNLLDRTKHYDKLFKDIEAQRDSRKAEKKLDERPMRFDKKFNGSDSNRRSRSGDYIIRKNEDKQNVKEEPSFVTKVLGRNGSSRYNGYSQDHSEVEVE